MPKPFEFTERALADLEELVASITRQNHKAALSLVEALEHAFLFLGSWPTAGHCKYEITQDESIRFWTANGYSIIYDATLSPILILGVLHGARDLASVLSSRLEQR